MSRVTTVARAFATRRLIVTFDKLDFHYSSLSPRKLINWAMAEMSYVARSGRAWAYPTHLQVEPSSVCNLRCPVCHVVTDGKPRGLLRGQDFQRLMDEVGDRLLFLHFWGWGEPFLNGDLPRMIEYARGKGVKIITSTNGHFFEKEGDVDRLLLSGLDALIVALDGVDDETYRKYRHNGDFERVIAGLRMLVRRKRELGVPHPTINLRMLVTGDNEGQVPAMKRLAAEAGVDVLTLKTLHSFDNEAVGQGLLPSSREYRRYRYDAGGLAIRVDNSCKKLWNHPTVYRDGTVVPCDYYTGEELSMGNVFSGDGMGFRKVWFSEGYRRLRSQFARKQVDGLRCGGCALNFAGVDRCVSHAFRFAGSHGAPPA